MEIADHFQLTLDGVTVDGTLDVGNSVNGASLIVTNGLVLNGTAWWAIRPTVGMAQSPLRGANSWAATEQWFLGTMATPPPTRSEWQTTARLW